MRSVNALLTIGKGQRVGIVAGSGVGKSILLSMMTRFSKADVIVVGLIGERGREVGAFVEQAMTAAGSMTASQNRKLEARRGSQSHGIALGPRELLVTADGCRGPQGLWGRA